MANPIPPHVAIQEFNRLQAEFVAQGMSPGAAATAIYKKNPTLYEAYQMAAHPERASEIDGSLTGDRHK